jgi:hypothetical protein
MRSQVREWVFTPEKKPLRLRTLHFCRLCVWGFAILSGVNLGLVTFWALYVPRGDALGSVFGAFLCLGMLGLLWFKAPWARQRPLALMFASIAGFGAMVGGLVLVTYLALRPRLGTEMLILVVACALLFLAGMYYAILYRGRSPHEDVHNCAG